MILAWLAIFAWAADPAPTRIVGVGGGAVLGGMLGPTQLQTGFSPSFLVSYDYGRGVGKAYVGARTAPVFLWVAGAEGIGAELLFGDLGFSLGDERMRIGPFATAGLLGAGAGVRAAITPFDTKRGDLRGLEARLTWFAPRAGNVGLYYVHAFLPPAADRDTWVDRPARRGLCRRFALGVGAAGTVSSTARSWEFVGQEVDTQTSVSPAVMVACEAGGTSSGWFVGGETAPFAFYRVPTVDGGADRTLYHMGSLTLGAFVGGDRARVGPIVTAGVWTLGGGVRAVITTVASERGTHHGLEARALGLVPSAPAGEAWLLYHVWFAPRRPSGGEDPPRT